VSVTVETATPNTTTVELDMIDTVPWRLPYITRNRPWTVSQRDLHFCSRHDITHYFLSIPAWSLKGLNWLTIAVANSSIIGQLENGHL